MALGAVFADRLAVALAAAQQVDQRATEDETEDQRREKRAPGPEGDVAKQVIDVAAVGKLGQFIEHLGGLACIGELRMAHFADRVNDTGHVA